jgi:hypothetical protein
MRRYRWFVFGILTACLTAAHGAGETRSAPVEAPDRHRSLRFILDMVHYNPGEPRYASKFADPQVIAQMGYNGKVYFLFDSPMLGINWESVDADVFPKGSEARAWVDALAAKIDAEEAACKKVGLKTYAMSDLILFPKQLVEKYGMQQTFGDPRNPQTARFLKAELDQVFTRFPNLDGLVVRIGETYLQDAPYHVGRIDRKTDPDATIIPLLKLLRDEICVKHNKELIFRTWLSFDTDLDKYLKVTQAIEPHPKLVFSVKHCEGDFHRPNIFSKILGQGHQLQIVEVQCAREYEGKGAYPNYVANGVIEGFKENQDMAADRIKSLREMAERSTNLVGVWSWSRGGGWEGPYIRNELWPELNAWVMCRWARDPVRSEESIFNEYATEKLHLQSDDVPKFRQLCLLSAKAVLLGKNTSRLGYMDRFWSRDQYISAPELPEDPQKVQFILDQRRQSVELWKQIVQLAGEIHFQDAATSEFVQTSCRYGEYVYRIHLLATQLAQAERGQDVNAIRPLLKDYDATWADYRQLAAQSLSCATLYKPVHSPWHRKQRDLSALVEQCRKMVQIQ